MARLDNTATAKPAGNGGESAGDEQISARFSPVLRMFISAKTHLPIPAGVDKNWARILTEMRSEFAGNFH
ncbi:hypothetical protein P8H27_02715 [Pseudomonas sp. sp1636]|uniref:hypothetical protein n=1 Tax=Pseudomonas sp. sp1636 TaxID=3036707 RepID=UPI0025A62525|nr:hypothetical protein [Pseudomonas sp. sp1636]MDM8347806.1 hypothetical protein [Pseudomonas sp. sp1636]